MHGPLTEVMIDAKDVFLIEPTQQDIVEAPGRVEIAAERLFDYDAGPLGATRFHKLFDHGSKQYGRDSQIVSRLSGVSELFAERFKRPRIPVVAVHVAQQAAQLFEGRGIESPMFFEAVFRTRPELVEVPPILCNADHRSVEVPAL